VAKAVSYLALGLLTGILAVRALASAYSPSVEGLKVRPVDVPATHTKWVIARGYYPRFISSEVNLQIVNQVMRASIVSNERAFLQTAIIPPIDKNAKPGTYEMQLTKAVYTANSDVVSFLIPTVTLGPGGTNGDWWFARTIRVPSGSVVLINDLFSASRAGINALSQAALRRLLRSSCVGRSLRGSYLTRIAPRSGNFRFFAFTKGGLALGFPQGEVAPASCGRVRAVVAYSSISRYLSGLGQRLMRSAEASRR
jgi:hypothetical protein